MQQDASDNVVGASKKEIRDLINKVLQTWTDVTCTGYKGRKATMELAAYPDVACDLSETDPQGPNNNTVIFRDKRWEHLGNDNTLGFTTVKFYTATGEIYGADIEINTAYEKIVVKDNPATDENDLQSILTHEMGHLLGLSHYPPNAPTDSGSDSAHPLPIMYAYYNTGTVKRTLTNDDIQGLCNAYLPNRPASCDPTPRGGFSTQCVSDTSPSGPGCALSNRDRGHYGSTNKIGLMLIAGGVAVMGRRRRSNQNGSSPEGSHCEIPRGDQARP